MSEMTISTGPVVNPALKPRDQCAQCKAHGNASAHEPYQLKQAAGDGGRGAVHDHVHAEAEREQAGGVR